MLDYAQWNALDEAHGMGALRRFLDPVLESGLLPRLDPEACARLLSGAIYYGVDWASVADAERRFAVVERDFLALLQALRRH